MGQLRPTTGQFYHRVRAAGEERRNVYSLIKLQQDEYCKLVATASYICQLPPPADPGKCELYLCNKQPSRS